MNSNSSFLIIAGVNKAGTTSLFSYLNQHPDLCGSSIKESCFFLPIRYHKPIESIEKYQQLFSQCQNPRYYMESTPGYFYGGQELINSIKQNLGSHVKIVLVFRDPVQRLLSFYKFQKSRLNLSENLTLEDYIKQCKSFTKDQIQLQENNPFYGIEGGKYADYIEPWLKSFQGNINIVFFENMKEKPYEILKDLAQWLGIDFAPFSKMQLEVENKTRHFNNRFIHKTALFFNDSFEQFFRANPSIKKKLRSFYFSFNEKAITEKASEKALQELTEYYEPFNQKLKQMLINNRTVKFPSWLP